MIQDPVSQTCNRTFSQKKEMMASQPQGLFLSAAQPGYRMTTSACENDHTIFRPKRTACIHDDHTGMIERSTGDNITAKYCIVIVNNISQRRRERLRPNFCRQTQQGRAIILKAISLISSRCCLQSDFDVWPNLLLNTICQRCSEISSHQEVKNEER